MPYLYIQSLPEEHGRSVRLCWRKDGCPENETEVIIPDFMTANEEDRAGDKNRRYAGARCGRADAGRREAAFRNIILRGGLLR